MARADCKVCGRDDKEEIEEIAVSQGPRAAGRAAGCSHYAVMRHMANHLTGVAPEKPSFGVVVPCSPTPAFAMPPKLEPKQKPKPKPISASPPPSLAVVPYKQRFPRVAALQTEQERRHYLAELFRLGRFHGFRTTGHLSLLWDDLGPFEFAELVTRAATEANFRRGSEQARRSALLGLVEKYIKKADKKDDLKTVARLVETLARLDVPVGMDMMTALLNSDAWRVIAPGLMKKFPAAFEYVHSELVAEESRKRQALAPMTVESNQDG